MTAAIFDPTTEEIDFVDSLRRECLAKIDESVDASRDLEERLGLKSQDIERLKNRSDWGIAAALRIAKVLSVDVELSVVTHA